MFRYQESFGKYNFIKVLKRKKNPKREFLLWVLFRFWRLKVKAYHQRRWGVSHLDCSQVLRPSVIVMIRFGEYFENYNLEYHSHLSIRLEHWESASASRLDINKQHRLSRKIHKSVRWDKIMNILDSLNREKKFLLLRLISSSGIFITWHLHYMKSRKWCWDRTNIPSVLLFDRAQCIISLFKWHGRKFIQIKYRFIRVSNTYPDVFLYEINE